MAMVSAVACIPAVADIP
jgi:hypothetical protein